MKLFPAVFSLSGRRVVILGGGALAARKARLLTGEGVDLVLIAASFAEAVRGEWADRARLIERAPRVGDVAGAALAIVAEEDAGLAAAHAGLARRARVPVNVVDQPALSDFQTPSIIDRGEMVVAVATGGAAPVLGRIIRERIERLLPARLGELAALARSLRPAVAKALPADQRRRFWERALTGPAAAMSLAGDDAGARRALVAALNETETPPTGVVHIVGAGPGDPELLTLRAHRLLQEADVIVYDRLVGDGVLALARRDAERIYVGKAKSDHTVAQDDIERLLIEKAKGGAVVVRLKGGDPFIFGRGGEELAAVRAAGVPVFVTPGITAALGCAAATGLPLTHRDHAQSVTFVTGHASGDAEPEIDWRALAATRGTLVFYMGVSKAGTIAARLTAAGLEPSTPVAVIENGTRDDQSVRTGTLAHLATLAADASGPALLVIGSVAALAECGAAGIDASARAALPAAA